MSKEYLWTYIRADWLLKKDFSVFAEDILILCIKYWMTCFHKQIFVEVLIHTQVPCFRGFKPPVCPYERLFSTSILFVYIHVKFEWPTLFWHPVKKLAFRILSLCVWSNTLLLRTVSTLRRRPALWENNANLYL